MNHHKPFVILFCLLFAGFSMAQKQKGASPASSDGWQQLFNSKDLKGWKQLNGKAKYEIVGDAIVGTSIADTPNSFLCTEQNYGDFILELEVKVDSPLNSGIQFRSLSLPGFKDGRVHGYQCEIDPSTRAWSGGIYDEARRGWLYPLTRNPLGQTAFRNGEWNKYRIEAIGNTIRTWINGIPCANLVDDLTPTGFIALQVHSVGKDADKIGKQVSWRNIRIKTSKLETSRMPYGEEIDEISYLNNTLTEREKAEGWRLLWDGKTTNGWKSAKGEAFPAQGWEVKDGTLSVLASDGSEGGRGGDVITAEEFSNFDLQIDFMLSEGANSGIKYFVDPGLLKGKGSAIGLEFQVLDDKNHPDAKMGIKGNRTVGSLYDLIRADNLSEPGNTPKRVNGPGQWNRARIISHNGRVEHWLNDIKVVEYERGTQMYRALVAYSKYQQWPNFGEWESGPILLQDHGDTVSFRNMKIRELD